MIICGEGGLVCLFYGLGIDGRLFADQKRGFWEYGEMNGGKTNGRPFFNK